MESLNELLEEELKDLYNAEHQLLKALPRVSKKANSPMLKAAIDKHIKETENQIARLEKAGKALDIKLKGKVCQAMKGLLEEAKEHLAEKGKSPIIDAALIGACQRVEHYEIAGYGVARALAQALGEDQIVKLLQQTLDEEGNADKKLTEVAEGDIYSSALGGEEDEESGEGEEEESEEMEEQEA